MASRLTTMSNERKEGLRITAKRSRFYDKSAPSTIDHRKHARSNFFEYCKTVYDIDDEPTMYARETLIDYVCGFLECMATVSEGALSEKVKACDIHIPTLDSD